MGVSIVLSQLLERRKRQPTDDQLIRLRAVLAQVYNVAFYIVGNSAEARAIAQRALSGLMKDYTLLKHRISNQESYRHSVWKINQAQSRIRKVPLPLELELAQRVFTLSIPYERATRDEGTRDDLDVSFCKCVLLESLRMRSNAFSLLIGLTNFIHRYTKTESISLFYALTQKVPRIQEPWSPGNEPFSTDLQRLRRAIGDEFRDYVEFDGDGELVRRPRAEQPPGLIAECIAEITLQETGRSCFAESVELDHSRVADTASELRRIHLVLHWSCYTEVVHNAGLRSPGEKAGMPEYTKMLKSNGRKTRKAPPLQEEELDAMVNEFQLLLEKRRTASTQIIVTVDGVEQTAKSAQLDETGHTTLRLAENSKLIEIWARDEGEADILLSAFFLSLESARETVTLEGGQEITLTADYAESDDSIGSFQVGIGYRETKFARKIHRAYRRKTGERVKRPVYTQPAFLVVLALVFFTAVVVMVPQIRNSVYVAGKSIFRSFTASPEPMPLDQNNATVRTSLHAPPTAHFTMSAQGKTVSDGGTLTLSVPVNGNVTVAFNSTSVQGRAPITNYTWKSNGTQICANSSTCSYNFGTASNQITLTVTDSNGLNSIATIGQTEAERRSIPNGQEGVRQGAFASEGRHPPRNNSLRVSKGKSVTAIVPSLATIKGIYVEPSGLYDAAELNALAHSSQVEALKESGLFEPRASPDEADARLKIISDFESGSGDKAQAQLVTAKEGKVIWYGPLLSISRDNSQDIGSAEVRNFVTKTIKALAANKKKPVHSRRRNFSKVRHHSSAKE